MKMHEDQADVDADLVHRLLADQSPHLSTLPITAIESTGTVNALFRVGEELIARLPLVAKWRDAIEREWEWLPWFSRRDRGIDFTRVSELISKRTRPRIGRP